jgi:hypothetical protein
VAAVLVVVDGVTVAAEADETVVVEAVAGTAEEILAVEAEAEAEAEADMAGVGTDGALRD